MPLGISDLKLKNVVFEARFERNYLHWDRAGQLWTDLLLAYPTLKVIRGEPHRTLGRLSSELEIVVQNDLFFVTQEEPHPNLKTFGEICDDIVQRTHHLFKITEFTRLGLRKIHVKFFETMEQASLAMLESGLLAMPTGSQFGISSDVPANLEWRAVWGDKRNGCGLQLRSEELNFELDLPLNWKGVSDSIKKKRFQMSWDVDFFTKGSVKIDQLSVKDWLAQASHAIGRDRDNFLQM
jgi:uncharacterized protein (TIGR04255 family)